MMRYECCVLVISVSICARLVDAQAVAEQLSNLPIKDPSPVKQSSATLVGGQGNGPK